MFHTRYLSMAACRGNLRPFDGILQDSVYLMISTMPPAKPWQVWQYHLITTLFDHASLTTRCSSLTGQHSWECIPSTGPSINGNLCDPSSLSFQETKPRRLIVEIGLRQRNRPLWKRMTLALEHIDLAGNSSGLNKLYLWCRSCALLGSPEVHLSTRFATSDLLSGCK